MTFDNFLDQAWSDHAKDANAVAARLEDGVALIEKNEQIPAIASLATHIYGEHLGLWKDGLAFLGSLRNSKHFVPETESEQAISRSMAILKLASGDKTALDGFANSDQIRILATAASALSERNQPEQAHSYFKQALELTQTGLSKEDPANRALAVTGNNLACALEEKSKRSESEIALMILAAEAGRKFWEIAGGWNEILWAEYRLAITHMKARTLQKALDHAQTCIEIAVENNAGAMELFYGYEALALTERSRGNQIGYDKALQHAEEQFARLGEEDKKWCEESLRKLKAEA